jgi:hypothetical protein
VQTSQDNPVVTGPAESTPTDARETTAETPTTTANPYVTTTTSIAGHI